jgi:hypothetical protein
MRDPKVISVIPSHGGKFKSYVSSGKKRKSQK